MILSIETSSFQGSLSLHNKTSFAMVDQITWHKEGAQQKGGAHSEVITLKLETLLQNSKKSIEDIKHIFVGQGPGSFTGLRVGVNLARSLGYALRIPITPIGSLRVLAEPKIESEIPILCIQNAFRNLVYVAAYEKKEKPLSAEGTGNPLKLTTLLEPQAFSLAELEKFIQRPFLCLGDGYEIFSPLLSQSTLKFLVRGDHSDFPHSQWAPQAYQSSPEEHPDLNWTEVLPLYIRRSSAEEKLNL